MFFYTPFLKYNISDSVLPEDILARTECSNTPGENHRATRERADRNQPKQGEPYYSYRMDKALAPGYATQGFIYLIFISNFKLNKAKGAGTKVLIPTPF